MHKRRRGEATSPKVTEIGQVKRWGSWSSRVGRVTDKEVRLRLSAAIAAAIAIAIVSAIRQLLECELVTNLQNDYERQVLWPSMLAELA